MKSMEELLQAAQGLPQNLIDNLVSYAKFLKSEYKPLVPDKDGKYRRAGLLKGRIFISDDFDEPLEDFKEYI